MALAALRTLPELVKTPLPCRSGSMSVVALFPGILKMELLPWNWRVFPRGWPRPVLSNALRYFDLPQIMALALPRTLLIRSSKPRTGNGCKVAQLAEENLVQLKGRGVIVSCHTLDSRY